MTNLGSWIAQFDTALQVLWLFIRLSVLLTARRDMVSRSSQASHSRRQARTRPQRVNVMRDRAEWLWRVSVEKSQGMRSRIAVRQGSCMACSRESVRNQVQTSLALLEVEQETSLQTGLFPSHSGTCTSQAGCGCRGARYRVGATLYPIQPRPGPIRQLEAQSSEAPGKPDPGPAEQGSPRSHSSS